jgi:[ribosomal protein S5]-alanine N-acetyltransferase
MLFQTPRLIVRPFSSDDAVDCIQFLSDPDVMKFIGDGNFRLEKTTAETMVHWYIQSCDESSGLGTWAIVDKGSGSVIGNCHLSHCGAVGKVEFGILLAKKHWRKGYGAELAPSLLNYGHYQLGLIEIVCMVHPNNLASKSGLVKLGYKFDRGIRHQGIQQDLYVKVE